MKTALIHVGLPKTGSTSIQDFLYSERGAMAAAGFLFPAPSNATRQARRAAGEGWGRHATLLAAVQGRWDDLAPGEWDLWRAEFARFRTDDDLHTLVLSHETIGNRAARLDLAPLLELLGGFRLRILLVVREAEAWLASLHEQQVAGRRRLSAPADAFRTVKDYERGGFQARIEAVAAAFPGAELVIAPFESLLTGDGLVSRSATLIGLPPALCAKGAGARQVNVSLSQERVEVLRRCNAAELPGDVFLAVRRALAIAQRRATAPRKPRRRVFGGAVAERIAARYAKDRAWLSGEHAVDLPAARATPAPFVLEDGERDAIVEEARAFLELDAFTRFTNAARTA